METLKALEVQVEVACLGVARPVKELQTSKGVKDDYTQYWIDEFVKRSRDFQKANPGTPADQIQQILMSWVVDNKSLVYNNYLLLEGKHLE